MLFWSYNTQHRKFAFSRIYFVTLIVILQLIQVVTIKAKNIIFIFVILNLKANYEHFFTYLLLTIKSIQRKLTDNNFTIERVNFLQY